MKVPGAFKDICPRWAAALGAAKTTREIVGFKDKQGNETFDDRDTGLNISHYNACVVGEAYLFADDTAVRSGEYGCSQCASMSNKFGRIVFGEYDRYGSRKKLIEQELVAFTEHWRKQHTEQEAEVVDTIEEPKVVEVVQRHREE